MVVGIHLTAKKEKKTHTQKKTTTNKQKKEKRKQKKKKKKNTCLSLFDMVVLNIFNSEINAFQVHAMAYVSLYPFSQSY